MTGTGGAPVQGGKYTVHRNHYRSYPCHRGPPRNHPHRYQNSDSEEKKEGSERPDPTAPAQPQAQFPSLSLKRAYGINPSVPTLLSRKKGWRVLTTRMQENKVDQ